VVVVGDRGVGLIASLTTMLAVARIHRSFSLVVVVVVVVVRVVVVVVVVVG